MGTSPESRAEPRESKSVRMRDQSESTKREERRQEAQRQAAARWDGWGGWGWEGPGVYAMGGWREGEGDGYQERYGVICR